MALSHSVQSSASYAILAQRLLQVACIILYSMLRLITSYNHIASIVDAMPVSTSLTSLANQSGSIMLIIYYEQRQRHRQRSYTKRAETLARHRLAGKGISFSIGQRPHHPSTPCTHARQLPMRKTPLPIKTAFLYVNIVY